MASKKPIDLTERLTRTVPKVTEVAVSDPVLPTRMTVTLEQLVPYDRNPRQSANPMYADLKDSIRNRGIQQPPRITRRPGAEYYMIMDGGNTRLQILDELWRETQDAKFFTIDCMFHPWVSEEHVLSGHLIENDMRGDIKLIERATGAKQWIAMLEEKVGAISLRESARLMTEAGWKMDPGNLTVLLYAIDHLVEHIPLMLWGGSGVGFVKEIRRCEKAFKEYWDSLVANGENPSCEFSSIWTETLQEFDDEERFDMEDWRRTLSIRVGDAMDESWTAVAAEVEAILQGEKPSGIKSDNRVYKRAQVDARSAHEPEHSSGEIAETGHMTRESEESANSTHETETARSLPHVGSVPTKKPAQSIRSFQIDAWTAANAILVKLQLEQFLVATYDRETHEGPTGIGFELNAIQSLGAGAPIRYYTYLQSVFVAMVMSFKSDDAKQYLYGVIDMGMFGHEKPHEEQVKFLNALFREIIGLNFQRTTPHAKTNKRHGEALFMNYVSQLETAIQGLRVLTDNKLEDLFVVQK